MIHETLQVSTTQFWLFAALVMGVDILFVAILDWRIKPAYFRELSWALVITAAAAWGLFAWSLVTVFWESYYAYLYPAWLHSWGILVVVALLYGCLALAFHWLSFRLPGHTLLNFFLLAGFESLLEHVWGIYGLKAMAVPMLQAASPLSILAFSFPEYVFYWCVIVTLAALIHQAAGRLRGSRGSFYPMKGR